MFQQVLGNDEDESAAPTGTVWNIDIYDGGKQTYAINLQGTASGIEEIDISGMSKSNLKGLFHTSIDTLVTMGKSRKTDVTFDPAQSTLSVQRIVGNEDLLNDIKAACSLNQITSQRVCKHLEKKAEGIQDALDKHRGEEAEKLARNFLRSLGENMGEGIDEHSFVQEPALTILKSDAEALLAQIKQDEKHNQ